MSDSQERADRVAAIQKHIDDAETLLRGYRMGVMDAVGKSIKDYTEGDYSLYLETEHWNTKRTEALNHYGAACVFCGSPTGLQVHHRNYERVGFEFMSDLVVLCGRCHKKHHGK